MPLPRADIDHRFTHHPPGARRVELHSFVRDHFRRLARLVNEIPDDHDPRGSREKSLALTALEEGLMWTNAHIARNVPEEDGS